MAAVAGRSPGGRSAAGVTTTSGAAGLTAPAGTFHEEDAGRPISGAGIPADATLASVESDTAATLSANATASGTITATFGRGEGASYGFVGWSPETDAESEVYAVSAGAGADAPDQLANSTTPITRRWRA